MGTWSYGGETTAKKDIGQDNSLSKSKSQANRATITFKYKLTFKFSFKISFTINYSSNLFNLFFSFPIK